jgi:hypothetical protein
MRYRAALGAYRLDPSLGRAYGASLGCVCKRIWDEDCVGMCRWRRADMVVGREQWPCDDIKIHCAHRHSRRAQGVSFELCLVFNRVEGIVYSISS